MPVNLVASENVVVVLSLDVSFVGPTTWAHTSCIATVDRHNARRPRGRPMKNMMTENKTGYLSESICTESDMTIKCFSVIDVGYIICL